MAASQWDRAALVPVRDGSRTPEMRALRPGEPSVEELFTFMRDAELRFATLRLRIEERTWGVRGEQLATLDVVIRHPGQARVVTSEPGLGAGSQHELWISDGETIRTYAAAHRLGTNRPIRNRPRGLDPRDYPGFATVYEPLTPLPMETLAELFVHPAGYCQNVLATGDCWISGSGQIGGREALILECEHPRAVELAADRPDYRIQVGVDRAEGLVTRLVESVAGEVTRHAEAVLLETDTPLPPAIFNFEFPEGTTLLY